MGRSTTYRLRITVEIKAPAGEHLLSDLALQLLHLAAHVEDARHVDAGMAPVGFEFVTGIGSVSAQLEPVFDDDDAGALLTGGASD